MQLLLFHILCWLVEFLLDGTSRCGKRGVLCFVATAASWLEIAIIFVVFGIVLMIKACGLSPVVEFQVRGRVGGHRSTLRSKVLVGLVAESVIGRGQAIVARGGRRSGSLPIRVGLKPTLRPERQQILVWLQLTGYIGRRVQSLKLLRILVWPTPRVLYRTTELSRGVRLLS